MVHWKKEWQSTPVFLLQEPHKEYEKVKKKKKKKKKKKSTKGEKISSQVECVQYATGEEWKNSSRKKEEAGPKQK